MKNPTIQRRFSLRLLLGMWVFVAILLSASHAWAATLKGVQSGTAIISDGATSATVTSPALTAVDPGKAFLVFGVEGSNDNPLNLQVSGQIILPGNTLSFQRSGTVGSVTIKWYVAEFTNGVTVQRGTASIPDTLSSTTAPLAPVSLANSFPIITAHTPGNNFGGNDFVRASFADSSTLQMDIGGPPIAGDTYRIEWQVVQYTDASVTSGSTTIANGSLAAPSIPIVGYNPANNYWLIYGYTVLDGGGNRIGPHLVRGMRNGGNIDFDRAIAGNAVTIDWFLVEFTDASSVQHANAAFGAAEATRPVAITQVDTARAIAAGGYFMRGGRSPYNTNNDDDPGFAWFNLDLGGPGNSSNLQISRGRTGDSADVGWFVVEFAGTSAISGTVFEDVNYGGGAGRDQTASTGAPVQNARIELYDAPGAFVSSTTTNASGQYSFGGLAPGGYQVRVVSDTITSTRPGASGSELGVQTYRTDASSGTANPLTTEVGGANPAGADDPANLTSANLSTLTTQSVAPVTLSGADVTGVDFGFNFDTIVNTNNAGQGSLRQFILNSNSLGNAGLAQVGQTAGTEVSIFMIPTDADPLGRAQDPRFDVGRGVASIPLASALPPISGASTVINGYTQPGAQANTVASPGLTDAVLRIELNGSGSGADGLSFANTSDGSTVRGLIITRFPGDGIRIQAGADNITVAGNWIGTDGSGLTTLGNGDGIELRGAGATIGGTDVGDRNVINHNGNEGINITGAGATGNKVLGNYIGLEPDGSSGAGNTDVGIAVLSGATGNTIGGPTVSERNVISRNFEGIEINSANNVVQGNYIGTDATGTLNRGNRSDDGVEIQTGGNNNLIGGTAAGAGNLIAFNQLHGVSLKAGTGNAVLGNQIHSNGQMGIDIGNNGVSANNGSTAGGLPNLGMDYPVFTSVSLGGTTLHVEGYVGTSVTRIAAVHTIEVFKAADDGGSNGEVELGDALSVGHGEGRWFIDRCNSAADGTFSCDLTVPGTVSLNLGDQVTATATDASNNTSEFGANTRIIFATFAKRAFLTDGTRLADGATLPAGTAVHFLLYINNRGGAVNDLSVQDALLPAFTYQNNTLRVDNSVASCAAASCTALEEDAILAAVKGAGISTESIDGDGVRYDSGTTTIDAGDQNVLGNGQVNLAPARTWALLFEAIVN